MQCERPTLMTAVRTIYRAITLHLAHAKGFAQRLRALSSQQAFRVGIYITPVAQGLLAHRQWGQVLTHFVTDQKLCSQYPPGPPSGRSPATPLRHMEQTWRPGRRPVPVPRHPGSPLGPFLRPSYNLSPGGGL